MLLWDRATGDQAEPRKGVDGVFLWGDTVTAVRRSTVRHRKRAQSWNDARLNRSLRVPCLHGREGKQLGMVSSRQTRYLLPQRRDLARFSILANARTGRTGKIVGQAERLLGKVSCARRFTCASSFLKRLLFRAFRKAWFWLRTVKCIRPLSSFLAASPLCRPLPSRSEFGCLHVLVRCVTIAVSLTHATLRRVAFSC